MNKLKITPILAGMIGGIIVLLVYESNIAAQVEDDLKTVSMHPCELAAHEFIDLMDKNTILYEQAQIEGPYGVYANQEYYGQAMMEFVEKQNSVYEKLEELKCHEKIDEWINEEIADRWDQSMYKARNAGISIPNYPNPFRMYLHYAELEQETQSSSAVTVTPYYESVEILGYDARDVKFLKAHTGKTMNVVGSDPDVPGKNKGEYVIVYVKNDSDYQADIEQVRLGGRLYHYTAPGIIPAFTADACCIYHVLDSSTNSISSQEAVVEPGQTVGIIFTLGDHFPTGKDTQFKLTTRYGGYVDTIVMGQNAG